MFRANGRSLAGFLVVATAALAARPVQAQAPPSRHEVAFGYSLIPYLEDADALPLGWLVAYAQADGDSPFGFVVEAAGNYATEGGSSRRLYTVQGGVRFMPRSTGQVRPFSEDESARAARVQMALVFGWGGA